MINWKGLAEYLGIPLEKVKETKLIPMEREPSSAKDTRNVADKYKGWMEDLIKEDLQKTSFDYAVMMENWNGDFNMGTLIRNANGCGAKEVFYYGKKRYDKRGAVGTYKYTNVNHLKDEKSLLSLKEKYEFIGIDNLPGAVSIDDFEWPGTFSWEKPPLMIFGEEGTGLTPEMQKHCSVMVEIPMYGSVRSFNCGTSSGMIMRDYITKFQHRCGHAKAMRADDLFCSACYKKMY